jgi:oligoribonuclease
MTGLNPQADVILEIATLVTDADLHILAEGPELVISQPKAMLDGMDEWNQTHHGRSGLIDRVLSSTISPAEAEAQTLEFLSEWVPEGASPICGNSICQDRRFLAQGMPRLERYFHYRNLDVSTLKELTLRWAPEIAQGLTKAGRHRALDDIRESIEELRYYRKNILRI